MSAVKRFEDLEIWKLARQQAKNIYQISFNLNPELSYQIRRSSASVMDNIAEGFARGARKEFKNFLGIAKGSNAEVKSQLYRIFDCEFSTQFSLRRLS
jgi:four helix bundle protein